MKASKLFLSTAFISAVLVSSPAFGDSVKFIGATGPVVGGVYVTPYQLQESGILGGATINVICDDYSDEVVPGETWNAKIETFSANGTLSPGAKFAGVPNSNTLYDEAVYLYSEFLSGQADAGGTNYAIWGLFDHSVVGSWPYDSTDAAQLLAGITSSDLSNFNYSPYEIITPTGPGSIGTNPQEFIYKDSPKPTPEPSSLLLLSGGLLGLGLLKRKAFQS